jgi:hypothetical protein
LVAVQEFNVQRSKLVTISIDRRDGT